LDLGLFDGYGELASEEQKQTVRNALEQGYVDDEDWKGVSIRFRLRVKGTDLGSLPVVIVPILQRALKRPRRSMLPMEKRMVKRKFCTCTMDMNILTLPSQKPKRGRPKKAKEANAEEDE
jgi:hypothetical protein